MKDYLIHTEESKTQAMNLYFLFLAAVITVGGAATFTIPESKRDLLLGLLAVLNLATGMVGAYVYATMASYRAYAFDLRKRLDETTARWAACRSGDYKPYWHLGNLVKELRKEKRRRGSHADSVPPKSKLGQALRYVGAALKNAFKSLKRLLENEKDLLLILVVNSFATGMFFWLLLHIDLASILALPGLMVWPHRISWLMEPGFWSVLAMAMQLLFYVRQDMYLYGQACKDMEEILKACPELAKTP
jgi:hypothetical protein